MKAIYVDADGRPCAMSPDSAVVPNRRPWFVPDFGGEWVARFLLAVRIGRLGKGIAPEFAYRYVDGVTVAVHPLSTESDVSDAISLFMDGALILGDWMEMQSLPILAGDARIRIDAEFGVVADAVSRTSRHITLKTGDVILIPVDCATQSLMLNSKLTAFAADGTQVLSINVK